MRRQPVALGAGRRARSVAVEGPRPAGDARPHRFPARSATALRGHAGALWLLLVPAARSRDKSEPSAAAPCRNSRRWWCRMARPGCRWRAPAACSSTTCCRPSWRERRWFPSERRRRSSPTLTSAIPFCDERRQPAMARVRRDDAATARRSRYVLPLQIEWARFDRERYNPQRARRRPPRRARRHAARRRHRPGFHRAAAANHARRRHDRSRTSMRLEFRPTSALHGRCRRPTVEKIRARRDASSPTPRRWSTTTMSSRSSASSNAGINPEIEIGRFLTEHRRLHATRRPARHRSNWSRATQRSALAVVHRFVENQGDAWTVTGAYLDRFVDEQRAAGGGDQPGESEEQASYLQLHAADRPARRRNAARAGQPRRHRGFRAGADQPERRRSAGPSD